MWARPDIAHHFPTRSSECILFVLIVLWTSTMELVTQQEQVVGTSPSGTQLPVSLDFHVVTKQ